MTLHARQAHHDAHFLLLLGDHAVPYTESTKHTAYL